MISEETYPVEFWIDGGFASMTTLRVGRPLPRRGDMVAIAVRRGETTWCSGPDENIQVRVLWVCHRLSSENAVIRIGCERVEGLGWMEDRGGCEYGAAQESLGRDGPSYMLGLGDGKSVERGNILMWLRREGFNKAAVAFRDWALTNHFSGVIPNEKDDT